MKHKSSIISGLLVLTLCCALALTGCSLRPEGSVGPAPAEATAEPTAGPTPTPEPDITWYTVTYRLDGAELSTERVPEGESPSAAPELSGDRAVIAWNNANGLETDIWNLHMVQDMVFDAVLGPELDLSGNYIVPEKDGLYHPLDKFTRSDAARAVYALMAQKPRGETFLKDVTTHALCWEAATSLVTEGYMTLDENGRFFPDVAIEKADMTALLEKLFSPGAVREAMDGVSEPMTRAEAAAVLVRLLGITAAEVTPYYPDVAPESDYYTVVELAGGDGKADWIDGERATPGFINLDGYLYCVRPDGYFTADDMVGTLYFDRSGRFTSGSEELDSFVADIIDGLLTANMSREDLLREVYVYVRDHYLYLKRNIYDVGHTGWEIDDALVMFRTSKGNCYNFTAAFWALARGSGFDAVCYAGLVGVDRNPHSWVEIEMDGEPFIFDVETEMQNRLNDDYYTSMYKMTYERGKLWSYAKVPYDD
ncbi:MAG: transglutaminase domain-containing protein [Oscillospiraceae bacterium]|nr:transglutaminase domain-containing protein [Oscillospiraceae bacterium]